MVDVIVVGGGVGGCGVAALLAQKGFSVLLAEPGKYAGGRCSSYEKDGFLAPTYVHAFARVDRGPCADIARELDEPLAWGREKVAVFNLLGNRIHSPIGQPIRDMINLVREGGVPLAAILKMGARITKDYLLHHRQFQKDMDALDIRSWLSKYTDDERLHTVMAFIASASFVIPYEQASMDEFTHIVKAMQLAGAAGYPTRECGSIAEAYLKGFGKAGGRLVKKRVKTILVKNKKVTGVEFMDGEKEEASVVISNAGIKPTVLDLVGEKHFPADYVNYIKSLEHSLSALVIKVALDKKITDIKAMIHMPTLDPVGYFKKLEKGEIPEELNIWVTAPSNLSPDLAPKGKQLICAGSPMVYRPGTDWKPWVEKAFETLEKIFPDIPQHTLWRHTVSPEQINKWAGKEGCVIGVAQKTGQVGKNRPSINSPLAGLYFVGSDVGTRAIGVELAAESALRCAVEAGKQPSLHKH